MRHHFSNPDRFTETGSSSHSLNRAPRKSIHINSRPLPILTLIAALEVKINILNPNFGVPRNYFLFILHDTILRKFHYEQTSIYLQYHSRNNPKYFNFYQHIYPKLLPDIYTITDKLLLTTHWDNISHHHLSNTEPLLTTSTVISAWQDNSQIFIWQISGTKLPIVRLIRLISILSNIPDWPRLVI